MFEDIFAIVWNIQRIKKKETDLLTIEYFQNELNKRPFRGVMRKVYINEFYKNIDSTNWYSNHKKLLSLIAIVNYYTNKVGFSFAKSAINITNNYFKYDNIEIKNYMDEENFILMTEYKQNEFNNKIGLLAKDLVDYILQ